MRLITAIAALSLLLTSCSKNIVVDYEPNVDFNEFNTYSWNALDNQHRNVYHNQGDIDLAVKNRMNELLADKGLIRAEDGQGDFFIDYHIYIEDHSYEVTYCPAGFYNSEGLLTSLIPGPGCEFEERTVIYDSGTLVIDIVNRVTGQLVWRGTALQVIDNPRFAPNLLSKKASKLLRQFRTTKDVLQ